MHNHRSISLRKWNHLSHHCVIPAVTADAQIRSFHPGALFTSKSGIKAQLGTVWALSVQMKFANAAGLIYNSSDGVQIEETRKLLWSMMCVSNMQNGLGSLRILMMCRCPGRQSFFCLHC